MKGVVFTEFLELVESRWGYEQVDRIVDAAELDHDGAYVATGTYHHGELVRMVVALSADVDVPVPALVRAFGEHLFFRFVEAHGSFFEGVPDSRSFLERVHDVIHVEVRKLYPDADLPSLECERRAGGVLDVHYRSGRHFADLAEGLIAGCIRHFDDELDVEREDREVAEGSHVVFRLMPRRAA